VALLRDNHDRDFIGKFCEFGDALFFFCRSYLKIEIYKKCL